MKFVKVLKSALNSSSLSDSQITFSLVPDKPYLRARLGAYPKSVNVGANGMAFFEQFIPDTLLTCIPLLSSQPCPQILN